jgi:23S rRNA (uracil1939-C5)-methyltransferase
MRVEFFSIAAGGDGVGRDENNRVVFAPYAAPGDVADVVIGEASKTFARGQILHLQNASAQRIQAPCPYFVPRRNDATTACGGCQIQHLDYAAQLEAKRGLVRDALVRIGRFPSTLIEEMLRPCVPSPLPFAYRNKADFVVSARDAKFELGLFARDSHHLIDILQCPIQHELNNQILLAARGAIEQNLVEPFNPQNGRGVLRRLVVRTASNGEALLSAVTTRAQWPQAKDFAQWMQERVPQLVGVLRREPKAVAQLVAGRDWLEETVLDLTLRVTGEGFFQINTSLTPQLVETAIDALQIRADERVLDVFCGVGLFSLAVARRGAKVLGIEANPQAIRDAKANAKLNGLEADFGVGDAARELEKLRVGKWDKVLLDPPRDGAAECMPQILRLQPQRVVYVSCDPATLARDLRVLCAQDYKIEAVTPLDMFPQTAHVETVVSLERSQKS